MGHDHSFFFWERFLQDGDEKSQAYDDLAAQGGGSRNQLAVTEKS